MLQIKLFLDKIPHWVFVGAALFAGAFTQNLKDQPDFLSALFSWQTANIAADLKMAGAFALTAFIAWLRTDPWTAAANKAAAAKVASIPPVVGGLLMVFFVISLAGCITSAPTVTPTPQNAAQIASCQSTASLHNGVVIGDMVVGGGATTLGAVAAAMPAGGSNDQTKVELGITAAALAGVTTIGAGVAALTASNFANDHCSDVVAPLPMKPQGGILPAFSELSTGAAQ